MHLNTLDLLPPSFFLLGIRRGRRIYISWPGKLLIVLCVVFSDVVAVVTDMLAVIVHTVDGFSIVVAVFIVVVVVVFVVTVVVIVNFDVFHIFDLVVDVNSRSSVLHVVSISHLTSWQCIGLLRSICASLKT